MRNFQRSGANFARRFESLVCAALVLGLVLGASVAPAAAANPPGGTVRGTVVSADGAPVRNAVVTLSGNGPDRTEAVDSKGTFVFVGLPGGTYIVRASARGYDTNGGRTIEVNELSPSAVQLTMTRSATGLVTIGQVQTAGGSALSTSSAPSTTINAQNYAALGYTMISGILNNDISTTLVHPLGGSLGLPTSVALRGPDPTETLVDIDGHQVNSGNSGDFDLSLLDPADFNSVELVKGIAPSSLVGPDTIDGAINLRTLEPTATQHGAFRLFGGSFNTFGATLETTGTADRLGYAVSLHRTTSSGEVNQTIYAVDGSPTGTGPQFVGSAVDSSTMLGKLRYSFGRGDAYVALTFHDQSQYRDLSAGLSSVLPPPGAPASGDSVGRHPGSAAPTDDDSSDGLLQVDSFAGSSLAAHNAGYGLDLRLPIGPPDASGVATTSVLFRHYTSLVSQSVFGPAADSSPYLYNDRDLISDDSLQIEHQFNKGNLTFQYDLRNENLQTNFVAGILNDESIGRLPLGNASPFDDSSNPATPADDFITLSQLGRSAVLRYTGDPSAKFHYSVATYFTDYSSFGSSFDPRFGVAWTPSAQTVVRASFGTTFQIPQLPELYVPPVLPPPVGGYINVGNPNLQPDRAAEYGLGFEQIFVPGPHRVDFSADAYRVNLRDPASPYLPPSTNPDCNPSDGSSSSGPGGLHPQTTPACPLSYPVNAGNAIYQGLELQASHPLAAYSTLKLGWAVRSAYLTKVPPEIQDGTLVVGEQSLGLPLHKATLSLDRSPPRGFNFGAGIVYEGIYNELDQPQFAVVNANIGYRFKDFELALNGTNLSDVYDQKFTRQSAGLLYGSLVGPLGTDAYMLQGTAFTFIVTKKF
jgi:outer membrane receptor protein involved in Fe transport